MDNQKLNNLLKDPNTNWKYIAIVAVVGLIALAGILACQNFWPSEQEISLPKIPKTSKRSEIPVDRRTYRNEEYGFEVKYPLEWTLVETEKGKIVHFGKPGEKYSWAEIFVEERNSQTIEQWLFSLAQESGGMDCYSQRVKNIKIGKDESAIDGIISKNACTIGWFDAVYTAIFSWKENMVLFHCVSLEDLTKILSAFRPIETENETDNWKTYRSEEFGFEFRYPQNFQVAEGLGQYFLNQKPIVELRSDSFNYLHNSIDAFFIVSVKSNAKAECEYIPRGSIDTMQNKEINGINFTMFSVGGAATGNIYSNTILHYLKDTTCHEVVATIHESSDGNTPEALPKINEQKIKLEDELDQILSTFRFLE